MNSFNGTWILDKSRNTNLKELLVAMGRSPFETKCVMSADETFMLEFKNNVFTKKVDIYITDKMLNALSILKPSLTRVKYENSFVCNGSIVPHPEDEKRFGKCDTMCYMDQGHIIIRWFLRKGQGRIMISDHSINAHDQLVVKISLSYEGRSDMEVLSTKVYNRAPTTN
jgi:hypothetical protein